MLSEIHPVRQVPGEGYRRWFTDEDLDLIVWYESEEQQEIQGFQLCYDKQVLEHALTWRPEGGFTHHQVDSGESPYSAKMSPTLEAEGNIDFKRISAIFVGHAKEIDPALVSFVTQKLREQRP
ncbi:MAG: hypothetical protein ACLFPW_07310 [Spirochaetaceae bacterium]